MKKIIVLFFMMVTLVFSLDTSEMISIVKSNPEILETPQGEAMLAKYGLTKEDVLNLIEDKEFLTKEKKEDKKKEKEKLKKLDADNKNDKECSSPRQANPEKMSDAEEKKWLKHLNSKSNTYLYKLNDEKPNRSNEDEKPW